MLKSESKRRRTQRQIQADKEAKATKERDNQAKHNMVYQLQQQVAQLQADHQTGKVAAGLMSKFIDAGLVEQKGESAFVIHGSHGDREFKAGDEQ